ncbi:MAG: T9SS type A sorting domain-containing protein [Fibrobacteres bacterium]|nr:T9SS type A sorting domain-containing protein [Fibrobacterota bacterium]
MIKNVTMIAIVLFSITVSLAAVPTNLTAVFRKGQTFITFTENSATQYKLYRSTLPISSTKGLNPIATILPNSGVDPIGGRHVITDLGSPLPAGTGLIVLTPKISAAQYYALTSISAGIEDTVIVDGSNATTVATTETPSCPAAVLTSIKPATKTTDGIYRYYIWMDYDSWPHSAEYYGSSFSVNQSYTLSDKLFAPLYIYLHALNSADGITEDLTQPDMIRINLRDSKNSWWFGNSSGTDNYTQRRVISCINAVKNDTARFAIDSNRIYLEGQSMGGKGTLHLAVNYPDIFAAVMPKLAPVYTWLGDTISRHPERELPPVIDFFGFKDSDAFGRVGHMYLYTFFKSNHLGIFGKWQNIGHQAGGATDVVMGRFSRFVKNEAYPAFSGSTRDWNYGQFTDKPLDSSGYMNSYFDWSSSLHRIPSLPGDTLIDCKDSVVMVIKCGRDNSICDITFRRLQRFSPDSGTVCYYTNRSIATGEILDTGRCVYNGKKFIIMPKLTFKVAGTRISVKLAPEITAEQLTANKAVNVLNLSPNPFTVSKALQITVNNTTNSSIVKIFNLNGQMVKAVNHFVNINGMYRTHWDGRDSKGGILSSGVYIIQYSMSPERQYSRKAIFNK